MAGLLQVAGWLRTHGVIFTFTVFILLIIVTYWPGLWTAHQRHAAIPLDDDFGMKE
jgi:cbb3-type cytochrome oxidase subunit 3